MFVPARQSSVRGDASSPCRGAVGSPGRHSRGQSPADSPLPPKGCRTPRPTVVAVCSRDASFGLFVWRQEQNWLSSAALWRAARLSVCRAVQTRCLQLILHNGLLLPKLCISLSQHRVFLCRVNYFPLFCL